MFRHALFLLLIVSLPFARVAAQDEPLDAGYDIGFDCPVAQTLDPAGDTLWVLFQGCFTGDYTLQAFAVADGAPLALTSNFAAELEPLADVFYFDRATSPLAFLDDHTLSIRYSDADTYAPHSIVVSLDGSAPAAPVIADDALGGLLSQHAEYPEATVYSHDQRQAAVVNASELLVLDLTTGDVIFSLPLEPDSYNGFPSFAPDGRTLYVATLDDFNDMDNYHSTLALYSLPDGVLRGSAAVPAPFVTVSPDARYAAVELGSNDGTSSSLSLVDLTSGATIRSFSLYEPTTKAMTCVNDGRDMSDVDFKRSGRLSLAGLDWLPDSSGIIFTRSYRGEGAGGGRPCVFDYSRLNRVDLAASSGG